MKTIPAYLLLLVLTGVALPGQLAAAEHEIEQLSVGYMLHQPTPSQFSRMTRTYDSAMGVEVKWVPFESGERMAEAIGSGEIQIAHSLRLASFVAALGRDMDMTIIGIAVAYPDYDNCVLRRDAGVAVTGLTFLEGESVALIPGGVTHFNLQRVLQEQGIDIDQVQIHAAENGTEVVAALRDGSVIMACADGATLDQLRSFGWPLLSGVAQTEPGFTAFDSITVATRFMHDHPELVQAFMDVTEATNAQWRQNPDPMRFAIARGAEMNSLSAADAMARYSFPSAVEQQSDAWLDGAVADYARGLAEFFVDHGSLGVAMESYAPYITTRFLR